MNKSAEIISWLEQYRVTSDGAIWTDHDYQVDPWFGNVTAIGLLEEGSPVAIGMARNWLAWCLAHVTSTGELYNYQVVSWGPPATIERRERSSQDNRTASTLSLAHHYLRITGDRDFFREQQRLVILDRIAAKVDSMVESSGLTSIYPRGATEYFQDNVSVYAGFRDYASFLVAMGRPGAAAYVGKAEAVRQAIEHHLFNGESYVVARNWGVDLKIFYPDAVNQVYALTYWGLPEQEARATLLWDKFLTFQKKWTILDKCDKAGQQFPRVKIANAALWVGDQATAVLFESNLREMFATEPSAGFVKPGLGYAWTTAEAGDYLVYLKRVGEFVLVDSDVAVRSGTVVEGTSTAEDGSQVMVTGDWSIREVAVVNETCLDSLGYYRPHAGGSYLHDGNSHSPNSPKSIRYVPNLRIPGYYDVRLVFADDPNRQHAVRVTVHDSEGHEDVHFVNQSVPMDDVNSMSLGVYRFDEGTSSGWVEVSNRVPPNIEPGTVVADAVMFLLQ